jgi:hypothetical protein
MKATNHRIKWPAGRDFAFTIFDDTDLATVGNVERVYSLLQHLGFCTTKSVWPCRGSREPNFWGQTCEDPAYLQWVRTLQRAGFEIGFHNATYHTSSREETIQGLERFRSLFGHYPQCMSNHSGCEESIYWGDCRLDGIYMKLYNLLLLNRYRHAFRGHVEGDPLFWGDYCKKTIKYVRNFVFRDINTVKACPYMPYHDLDRPWVNYWFASSEGPDVQSFSTCLSEQNQDRLEQEGGACIMYSHLASGFQDGSSVQPRFVELMNRLSRKNGWFVPVSTLLDFLLHRRVQPNILPEERALIQRRWLLHKIRVVGTT